MEARWCHLRIIALCGQTASGKSTLFKKIVSKYPEINPLISFTTRPKREGEQDSVDYFFITKKEYEHHLLAGDIIAPREYLVASGGVWYYGINKNQMSRDGWNIGIFDPEGLRSIQKYHPEIDLTIIYVDATPKTRLHRYLNRDDCDVWEICRRMLDDKEVFQDFEKEFDCYRVWNETSEDVKYFFEIFENFL